MTHEYVEKSAHGKNSVGERERRIENSVRKMARIQSPNSDALSVAPMTARQRHASEGKDIAKYSST